MVSQGSQPDEVVITLNKDTFLNEIPQEDSQLTGTQSRRLSVSESKSTIVFSETVPKLVLSESEKESLQEQALYASSIMTSQFFASFALQIFLSGALSMLWNIFNTL